MGQLNRYDVTAKPNGEGHSPLIQRDETIQAQFTSKSKRIIALRRELLAERELSAQRSTKSRVAKKAKHNKAEFDLQRDIAKPNVLLAKRESEPQKALDPRYVREGNLLRDNFLDNPKGKLKKINKFHNYIIISFNKYTSFSLFRQSRELITSLPQITQGLAQNQEELIKSNRHTF